LDEQQAIELYSTDEQCDFIGRGNLCAGLEIGKFFLKVNKIANS
jgi:hypothetical protein